MGNWFIVKVVHTWMAILRLVVVCEGMKSFRQLWKIWNTSCNLLWTLRNMLCTDRGNMQVLILNLHIILSVDLEWMITMWEAEFLHVLTLLSWFLHELYSILGFKSLCIELDFFYFKFHIAHTGVHVTKSEKTP